MRRFTALLFASLTALSPAALADDDDDLTIDQLPKAARDTVVRETKGGTITEIDRENEKGKVYFEVEFTQNNKRFEIHVAEDGKLLRRKED